LEKLVLRDTRIRASDPEDFGLLALGALLKEIRLTFLNGLRPGAVVLDQTGETVFFGDRGARSQSNRGAGGAGLVILVIVTGFFSVGVVLVKEVVVVLVMVVGGLLGILNVEGLDLGGDVFG
jgi:hypothetical protein